MKFTVWCLLVVLPGVVLADDWPQWQGPNRNAVSAEKGLLQTWPEKGLALAWKATDLGGGDSAPAVASGKLFGMSSRDGKEIVWALSEKDGKELWVTPLGNEVQQRMPQSKEGPGGTPTVDGDKLYVIGMGGTVACLNVEDGNILWRRSFTEDFGGSLPAWSFRESPLVDGDKLICTPGGPEALIVALDKSNGKTVWKSKLPGAAAETTRPATPQRPRQPNRNENQTPQIADTKDPELFVSEHWGMTGFSQKVPNGRYTAKLYFAETFAGIRGEGQRVFTFKVHGKEFKDFDVWKKAGGPRRAYIESLPVEITNGTFEITFTRQVENPAIKAVELIPAAKGARAIRVNAGRATEFKDSQGQVWQADTGFQGGSVNANTLAFGFGGGRRPGGFGQGRRGSAGGARAAYSSVIAIEVLGRRQYVQLTSSALVGVAAADGKFLWRYDRPANRMGINCSTPIFADGLVFAASAYGTGGGAVKLEKGENGAVEANEAYFSTNMQNHHGGMIVVDGCLYGANGGNGGGFLVCMDFKTGKVLWRDRKAPKGSLAMADGRLYLRVEDGTLLLIEPSRKELKIRGQFEQPDRSRAPAWAHPVIANGKLYVRDQGLLFCYDIAKN